MPVDKSFTDSGTLSEVFGRLELDFALTDRFTFTDSFSVVKGDQWPYAPVYDAIITDPLADFTISSSDGTIDYG